jgi:DNA-binding MarR family transcriptional regulator
MRSGQGRGGSWQGRNSIEELLKTIIEFYEKLSTWEEGVVKDSGLTTAQNHPIEIVDHEGSIKMIKLAEKLGVTSGTLTVSIDRLEEKGLLRRVPTSRTGDHI